MATKASASDDRDLETEDDAADETEETEEELEDDEEKDDKPRSKSSSKPKETNEERLEREMATLKKQLRSANRTANEAKDKLTKAGISDKDDPEDIRQQLAEVRTLALKRAAQLRVAQENDAIREVLSENDDYAAYLKSVKYIRTELDLSDDDLDADGEYDTDALRSAAERAVRAYVKNAPKPIKSVGGKAGTAGGPGGDPARGGPPKTETQMDKDQKLDKLFGGALGAVSGGSIYQNR